MALEKILKNAKKIFGVGALALSSLFYSCEKDFDDGPKYQRFKDPKIYEKTFVLKDEPLGKIKNISSEVITFSEPMMDNYGMKKGDILVAGITSKTPYGLLQKITGFSQDQKSVFVENASLEEVIKEGTIELNQNLKSTDLVSYDLIPGSMMKSASGYSFHIDFGRTILYDIDGKTSTTNDQLVATGDFSFNIKPKIKFVFQDGASSAYFGIEVPGSSNLKIESTFHEANFEKEIKIWKANFSPFTIPAPVPIVIFPKVELYVGANGIIKSQFELNLEDNFSASAGLSYNSKSNPKWSWNKNFSNEFLIVDPKIEFDLSAKAYVAPRVAININGILGPYGGIDCYLRADANILKNPWWNLYGGLEGKLGIDMNLLSKLIPDFEKTIFTYEKEIANAGGPFIILNSKPVVNFSVSPSSGNVSTNFKFDASSSSDKEDSPENLEVRWDYDYDKSKGYLWDTPFSKNKTSNHIYSSPGVYSVAAEVKDTKGLTSILGKENFISVSSSGGGNEGKILFCSNPASPSNFNIYSINTDGTNQINLTNNSFSNLYPCSSSDGTKMVFTSDKDSPSFEVYFMDLSSKNISRITSNNNYLEQSPSFSSDNKKIIYGRVIEIDDIDDIYSSEIANPANVINITKTFSSFSEANPSCSSTNKIVFAQNSGSNDGNDWFDIHTINLDGSNRVNLTKDYKEYSYPRWSPDGNKIVFVLSGGGGKRDIGTINSDGSGFVNLTKNSSWENQSYYPSFSPDGTKIVYSHFENSDGDLEIYIMNSDGTNKQKITNNSCEDIYPFWKK